jgi:hypothetical protein
MLPGSSRRGYRFAPQKFLSSLLTFGATRHPVRVSLAIAGVLTPTPSDAPLFMIRAATRELEP